MLFPDYRPRRMRQNEAFRRMVRETHLNVDDLILPLFATHGKDVKNPIPSMPGIFNFRSTTLRLLLNMLHAWAYLLSSFSAFLPKRMPSGLRPTPKMALCKMRYGPSKRNPLNFL